MYYRYVSNTERYIIVYINDAFIGSVNIGSWTPGGTRCGITAYSGSVALVHSIKTFKITGVSGTPINIPSILF